MDSGKVTAVATSVIAISILGSIFGFIFNKIYNTPQKIKERCTAKLERAYEKYPSKTSIYREFAKADYRECMGLSRY